MTKASSGSTKDGLTASSKIKQSYFDIAIKLATTGASLDAISQELTQNGCTGKAANDVMESLLDYFRVLADFNPETERGKAYARLNLIFLNSLKIQDYKTALATQKELNKLLDLYGRSPSGMIDI